MTAPFRSDPPALSVRAQLNPLEPTGMEAPPRDQQDLMQHPFFSLAKAKRVAPILYRAGDVEVQVHALPAYGMASIWDADLLIWAGSQIVEAADRSRATSRFVRFKPYHFLTAVGRGPDSGKSPAEGRALAAAVHRHPHHGPQRRAQATRPVLLGERMGRAP